MAKDFPSSSQLLLSLKSHDGDDISIAEISARFREGGFALMLIIFAFPMALPIPAMGIAQIMSLPIIFLSAQLMVGKHSPWLPNFIARKRIKMSTMGKFIDKAIPRFEKLELLLRPRIKFLSTKLGEKIIGAACLISAICVAAPIPFSNTTPSIGIVVMSVGLLERDGRAILIGMTISAIGLAITAAVLLLGAEALKAMF